MSPRATTRQNISTQTWMLPRVPVERPRCVQLCSRMSGILQAIQQLAHFAERGALTLPITQISWRVARQYTQGNDMLTESLRHRLPATLELPFSRTIATYRVWPIDCFAIPRSLPRDFFSARLATS